MKNLFSRTFSLLCAVTLLICAVSSWAFAEEPATPTDLTAEEGTVQAGTNNSGGSNEDPAESVEILITKSLKLGESWEGVAKNTRPAILKLDLDKAETVYMILEGNHVTAAIQKADRPEEILYTVTTDPETKQAVISWEAEQGSYLITVSPEEPNLMAKARITFLDEEAYKAWEEEQETASDTDAEEDVDGENAGQETEDTMEETIETIKDDKTESNKEKTVSEENKKVEDDAIEAEEKSEDENLQSILDLLPDDRSISYDVFWDVENPAFGDTAHFVASIQGYDAVNYSIQWQYSEDDINWNDIYGATTETMDIIASEENYLYFWRVTVYIYLPEE